MERLIDSFDEIFDLDVRVDGQRLGDLVLELLRRVGTASSPDWGMTGDPPELVREETGPFVQFCYRPHLFPGMDPLLRDAHRLQFHLLPRDLPPGAPVSIAALLESYCHLSGDLFGWERLRDGGFLMWILDVAGHGVRAGICSALVRVLVERARRRRALESLLTALNESLNGCIRREHDSLFATGFFLVVDADGRVDYASAGHPPVFVRRKGGGVEAIRTESLPLGILPDLTFPSRMLRIAEGDALLFYTDGVIESTDETGEPFGLERLKQLFSKPFERPEEMTARIYRAVGKRQDMAKLQDDITFFVASFC